MDKLDAWMKSTNTSQAELARQLECDRSMVTRLLSGERQPSIDLLGALVRVTGIPADELWPDLKATPPPSSEEAA
jgi:transcriptional regulator with XRE-family HTH domain